MILLNSDIFSRLKNEFDNFSRNLEHSIFNYVFLNGNRQEIKKELKKYINTDGGFGKGLEPDFQLLFSSATATSMGMRYAYKYLAREDAKEIVESASIFLEKTFNKKQMRWFSVPKEVNDFAHAPWWTYRDDIEMSVIDYSWGNPTAEIIGYLYNFDIKIDDFSSEDLLEIAIEKFNKKKEYKSEHEVFCYIRLYNLLPENQAEKLRESITEAIDQLLCRDYKRWRNEYLPKPLDFIKAPSENHFNIQDDLIQKNLDLYEEQIKNNTFISPTWEWGSYPDDWERSKKQWTGILTLNSLITLKNFNRLK